MDVVSPRQRRVSVLVVGAGPTGLTTANLLGQAGVDTLLVERNAGTVEEPRAVSIDDESFRTMQAIGLSDTVLTRVILGTGYHYISPSGRCFAKIEPTTREYGYPRRSNFHQPVLEAILREGLQRFQNVAVWFCHILEGVTQDDSGVVATVRDPEGRGIEVRADYLVGCDGARSTTRKLLTIDMGGSTYEQKWLILDTVNDTDAFPHSRFFCHPERPTVSVPGPGRTRRWEFMLRPGETEEEMLTPESIRALLTPHRGDGQVEITRKTVYTFHARIAERWSEGRVFLAGDAAHLTPPFAGQGMNTGIRDATNLAWKLAAVVQGQMGRHLLETYEEERRGHAWQMIMLAVRLGYVMMPTSAWRATVLTCLLQALSIVPNVKDYILQMRFKPKPRFTRGFFIADGRPSRTTLTGRMFPQPRVISPEGREVLLDDVLGNGFALLRFTAGSTHAFDTVTQEVWQRLKARRVCVTPYGCHVPTTREENVVGDAAGVFPTILQGYDEHIVVIRPDRYVAGAFTPDRSADFAAAFERLADTGDAPRAPCGSLPQDAVRAGFSQR